MNLKETCESITVWCALVSKTVKLLLWGCRRLVDDGQIERDTCTLQKLLPIYFRFPP